MFKAVFRPSELVALPDKIAIESPTSYPDLAHLATVEEAVEELNDIEEFTGPTADDLRREAEMFKVRWEEEKQAMITNAMSESERIIEDAHRTALKEIKSKTEEGELIKQQAESEAERIIEDAKTRAGELEKEVRQTLDGELKDARDKGYEEGRVQGYAEGKAEVDRLVERTQKMLERAQNRKDEILKESEQEIIDLVLLISRKIIKVISENQREVIIYNVIQALRKVKSRGTVTIRVNLSDLQLTTEHKEEFIKLVEGVKSIQILEDSTVDSGGCIIETDFGEIDARISSQLAELESKILEISPIKSTMKDKPTIDRAPYLAGDLAASSSLQNYQNNDDQTEEKKDSVMSDKANAALTVSAALAALATLGTKGKRKTDADMIVTPPRYPKQAAGSPGG